MIGNNFKAILNKHSKLFSFIAKAVGLYILWQIFYYFYLSTPNFLDEVVIGILMDLTKLFLDILGFDVFIGNNLVGIIGTSGIIIGPPCNGIDLIYLFVAFFIALEGKLKTKIIFILLGSIVIFIFNVIRLVLLAIILKYNFISFDFHHSYTFTLIMYVIIFAIWYFYLKKYAFAKK